MQPGPDIRSTLTRANCGAMRVTLGFGILGVALMLAAWVGLAILALSGALPGEAMAALVGIAGAGLVIAISSGFAMDGLRQAQLARLDLAGPLGLVRLFPQFFRSRALFAAPPPPRFLT